MTQRPRHLGPCFEDFDVGDVIRHPLGRTIDITDNRWFTLLTMNTHEAHFNADMAARTEFGREIVNSALTLSVVLGLTVSEISQNAVANLGWEQIKLLAPVFVGDTLYAESAVLAMRESRSRPHCGVVTTFTRGVNQRGEDVLTFVRSALVMKREHAASVRGFPEPSTELTTHLKGAL